MNTATHRGDKVVRVISDLPYRFGHHRAHQSAPPTSYSNGRQTLTLTEGTVFEGSRAKVPTDSDLATPAFRAEPHPEPAFGHRH